MKRWKELSVAIVLGAIVLLEIVPFVVMLRVSLMEKAEIFDVPLRWFGDVTFEHYRYLLTRTKFMDFLRNSVIVATVSTVLVMLIGTPAAFVLAKHQFKRREAVLLAVLGTRVGPPVAFAVPIYDMMMRLRLIDTHIALVVLYVFANLAFVIWLMHGFFRETDRSVEEAAMLDGLDELGVFLKISLPMVLPGLVAAATLVFILSWNEFFYALVLTRSAASTVPVLIPSFFGAFEIEWGAMFAACLMGSLVPIVLGVMVRKFLVRGLTMGAVR